MLQRPIFIGSHEIGDLSFYPTYKRVMKNQWKPLTELRAEQDKQLRYMIQYCNDNVPFYHTLFKNLDIRPDTIKKVNDLQKLPVLTKEIIKENWDALKPVNLNRIRYCEHATGGSTGTPMKYWVSSNDRFLGGALLYRGWGYAGYNLSDRMVFLAGSSLDTGTKSGLEKKLPNPAVLAELGLTEGDPFIIVRFVSWNASHDVGQHGIQDKIGLVKALEQYGHVLITSEGSLPPELQPYQIRISPEKLYDLLYYATLYVGEGATTASECTVLGTHAIYVNILRLGYIAEENERYHLVSDFSNRACTDEIILAEAKKLLQDRDLRKEGKRKSEILIQENCDVTAFMVWFIENYPRSFAEMKEHPEVQHSCASAPGDAS